MASKGQKFKKLSPEIKREILKKYFDGEAGRSLLSATYGVSINSIKNLICKTKKGVDVTVDHRKGGSGRPKSKNLTLEDYKERYEILKNTRPSWKLDKGKSDLPWLAYQHL